MCTCTEVSLQDKPFGEADAYCSRCDAVDILPWPVQLLPVSSCYQSLQNTKLILKVIGEQKFGLPPCAQTQQIHRERVKTQPPLDLVQCAVHCKADICGVCTLVCN